MPYRKPATRQRHCVSALHGGRQRPIPDLPRHQRNDEAGADRLLREKPHRQLEQPEWDHLAQLKRERHPCSWEVQTEGHDQNQTQVQTQRKSIKGGLMLQKQEDGADPARRSVQAAASGHSGIGRSVFNARGGPLTWQPRNEC